MVFGEQPGFENHQNQGTNTGLQEEPGTCSDSQIGVHLSENLFWSATSAAKVKKTRHFRELSGENSPDRRLQSILTYCISVVDKKALQRVVKAITSCLLPPLEGFATARYLNGARNIIRDSSHPGHGLLELLPSGKRYTDTKHIQINCLVGAC